MVELLQQRPSKEPLPLLIALGAKQMVFDDASNTIQFKVKGDRGINYVRIHIDVGADLYDVDFGVFRKFELKIKESLKGLGWEGLVDLIWGRVVIV